MTLNELTKEEWLNLAKRADWKVDFDITENIQYVGRVQDNIELKCIYWRRSGIKQYEASVFVDGKLSSATVSKNGPAHAIVDIAENYVAFDNAVQERYSITQQLKTIRGVLKGE